MRYLIEPCVLIKIAYYLVCYLNQTDKSDKVELARFFSLPKPTSRACSDGRGGGEQMVGKGIEMKASVKAIREGDQVAGSVFGEVERMIGTAETGFKVTQDLGPVEAKLQFDDI